MKAMIGFLFFMLFLAGIALVNLRSAQESEDAKVGAAADVADVAWKLTHLGEMALDDRSNIYLQFQTDGQFSGNAGCNRFFGTAEFAADVNFGGIGATRRACPEPVNSYELSFLEALGKAVAALRIDNRLALRDAEGQTVLRFTARPRLDE